MARASVSRACVGAALAFGLLIPTPAFAQPDPTTQPPPPPAPPTNPTPPTDNTPPAQTPPSTQQPPAAQPPGTEKKDPKWYDVVNLGAFVDTYYSQNWNRPRPNANANRFHPYTANTGFNLAWVGLDASVDPDPVGAQLQLRFGPSVPNLALGDFNIPGGIGFLQNANVSWKPGGKDGKLLLVMGKFDTVYGAEVAQSQLNINYTRGYLYNLAQPFFHTGLRAEIALTDMITLKLLAVNGWNNTVDNNRGKTFGAQIAVAPAEGVSLSAGYMGGPEEDDISTVTCAPGTNFDGGTSSCVPSPVGTGGTGSAINVGADSRWRHLIDVVGDVTIDKKLRLVVNGDFVTQTVSVGGSDTSVGWYGAALLARYPFSDVWAIGARGEVIKDKDGQLTLSGTKPMLYTGTLTIEAAPHKMMLIRLDNRIDAADERLFGQGREGLLKTQLTSTLGVVVKTN